MRLFDTLLGRSKPTPPNLDQLFALPSAAVALEAATRFRPTGTGAVCFRAAEGGSFTGLTEHIAALLTLAEGKFATSTDRFGYSWATRSGDPLDLEGLVTDLHAVNTSLLEAGYGAALLCTVVSFIDEEDRRLALIYLYKRGTWYPYAPQAGEHRDSALELQVRAAIQDDLRIEEDLTRWFPVHDAPGL